MTDTRDELLPCPFCGGKPRIVDDDSYEHCQIFCIGCEIEPCVLRPAGKFEEAVAVWNRRAAITAVPATERVEAAAAAIIELMSVYADDPDGADPQAIAAVALAAADAVPAAVPGDVGELVASARQLHREITEADRGESEQMKQLRELFTAVESLSSQVETLTRERDAMREQRDLQGEANAEYVKDMMKAMDRVDELEAALKDCREWLRGVAGENTPLLEIIDASPRMAAVNASLTKGDYNVCN